MPELPEVETVRGGLIPAMEGQTLRAVTLRRAGLRWPFPPGLSERLTGARILALRRRSKYILIETDKGDTAILHLGMSGRITVSGLAEAYVPGQFHHQHPQLQAHDHVIFDMENGARVTFNDPRRFGALDICETAVLERHPLLASLGPEPLGNDFHAAHLALRFHGRRSPVKAALLDQRNVAGLGNIYVCEALHRAGIHPTRAAGRISAARLERLATEIRIILLEAIDAGGSSLRDYRQADGELGYFQHGFRAYGREGQPCLKAGCGGTLKRIVQSGRSTWFCPACQR